MKFLLFLIIILSISAVLMKKIDYCWRNYNGDVPDDAIEAGVDQSGKPIYVGQGFFLHHGLLPGTLHSGSTHLKVTAVQKVFQTDKFVKILCSGQPHNFQWISINNYTDIARLTNVHLVEGGVETDSVVHIGRIHHEGSTEIGKVYNIAPFQGLALPNRQQTESSYQSFELLTYNTYTIDTRYN